MERIEVGDRVRVKHGTFSGQHGEVVEVEFPTGATPFAVVSLPGHAGAFPITHLERVNDRRFWCVWREGGGSPTVKHPRPDDAVGEAARLARINAGDTFHVLEAIASARAEDVAIIDAKTGERLPTPDTMPF